MSTLVPLIEAITLQSLEDPESRTVSLVAGVCFHSASSWTAMLSTQIPSRLRHDELARPGLGSSSRSCLALVTASSRCFAMGYSPQWQHGDAAAQGSRLFRVSINRNRLHETYSILRYSGEISSRFIAAFSGAENSSEAIRSISLFNLRLLTS
jgi:hypothetical protein